MDLEITKNNQNYYITEKYSVAMIPKSGCSTLARATIKAFQPEQELEISKAKYPQGKNEFNTPPHILADKESTPSKQIIAFIREPIERFLSAMVQLRLINIEETLDAFDSGVDILNINQKIINPFKNIHFRHQYKWVNNTTKLYKFPDHLEEGALEIGYSLPLPVMNPGVAEKPTPTPEQQIRILNYFNKDKELFDSINNPGILLQDALGQNWIS